MSMRLNSRFAVMLLLLYCPHRSERLAACDPPSCPDAAACDGDTRQPQQVVDLQRRVRQVRAARHAHGGDDHAAVPGTLQQHPAVQLRAGDGGSHPTSRPSHQHQQPIVYRQWKQSTHWKSRSRDDCQPFRLLWNVSCSCSPAPYSLSLSHSITRILLFHRVQTVPDIRWLFLRFLQLNDWGKEGHMT